MRQRLCRNLDALRIHRPRVYRTLIIAEPSERYGIVDAKTGALTIERRHDDGRKTIMSGDGDPLGAVQKVMTSIDAAYRGGTPLGLASIGDGYLLSHIAANPPELILGRRQAITLIEPDAHLMLACLMLHDSPAGDLARKLQGLGRFPVSGYTTSVDWAASAILEFTYFDLILSRGLEPAVAADYVARLLGFAADQGYPEVGFPAAGFRFLPVQ